MGIVVMLCWTTRGNTDVVKRFSNVWPNSQTMERTPSVLHSTGTITHRTVLETAGALFSDKSGKKYRKPTSRTQDG